MKTYIRPQRSFVAGIIFGSFVIGMCYCISSYASPFMECSITHATAEIIEQDTLHGSHLESERNGSNSAGVETNFPDIDLTTMQCPTKDSAVDPSILAQLDCKKRLPHVIGIGMAKCGTGALSSFLSSHPSLVHSVPQEIYYWNRNKEKNLEWYRDQMPISSKHQVTMEKTPSYIFEKDTPARIKELMPETKFIVMIRDPIVRAVSDYLHQQRIAHPRFFIPRIVKPGNEPDVYLNATFEGSVIKPNGEVNTDNSILSHSAYVLYLKKWIELFPRHQFLAIDGDEFVKNPLPVLHQVESFLGIPNYFNEKIIYFDEQKGFFCMSKRRGSGTVCRGDNKGRPHPNVDEDVIRRLRSYFRPYNIQLENMLGKRFTWS
ncbi:heparan sulfate glucosamine 3-O-sulfotransferase 3A1-like isoform X1 [Strongylocentrotus purpuratus]|uniref:Sulfotransferase domain-containing protein n=2 Tax=Strongylocentrotus purpuratus TaxID=7668 RepID=A0A7M7NJN0_STRPU|nr:heparan sulfate glucosamine 3-O-sulfotransferase 3A1-like isoform X1 [Strongylocentrotus purpuratus]